jgi:oxygen-independent coproporphyrinogen-3 oxidase
VSVIAEEEILTDSAKFEEAMMLGVRIRRGLQISALTPVQNAKLQDFRASGEIDEQDWTAGYLTLTPIGRLRADLILRAALLEIN